MEGALAREAVQRRRAEARVRELCGEAPDVFARAGLRHVAPWPAWLSALSLAGHPHLLPRAEVGEAVCRAGVTLYAIEVTLDADARGAPRAPRPPAPRAASPKTRRG